jgi:predicted nucleic acid-binding protein
MSVERFLDTNILVYAHDASAPRKRDIAQALIFDGLRNEDTAISAQVLSEFYVTVTRKIAKPLSPRAARDEVLYLSDLDMVDIDALLILSAIEMQARWKLAYWDALILAAADRCGAREVLSEDLSHGQAYGRIVVRYPFA